MSSGPFPRLEWGWVECNGGAERHMGNGNEQKYATAKDEIRGSFASL